MDKIHVYSSAFNNFTANSAIWKYLQYNLIYIGNWNKAKTPNITLQSSFNGWRLPLHLAETCTLNHHTNDQYTGWTQVLVVRMVSEQPQTDWDALQEWAQVKCFILSVRFRTVEVKDPEGFWQYRFSQGLWILGRSLSCEPSLYNVLLCHSPCCHFWLLSPVLQCVT